MHTHIGYLSNIDRNKVKQQTITTKTTTQQQHFYPLVDSPLVSRNETMSGVWGVVEQATFKGHSCRATKIRTHAAVIVQTIPSKSSLAMDRLPVRITY
jgi:hypothetical protein